MKNCRIKVKGFGKIKEAFLEPAELTLFVGDNNSGKSYLMSLLWGIDNLGVDALLGRDTDSGQKTKAWQELFYWVKEQADFLIEENKCAASMNRVIDKFQSFLQEQIKQNKDDLIKKIFNSQDVAIQELEIELRGLSDVSLSINRQQDKSTLFLTLQNKSWERELAVVFGKDIKCFGEENYWLMIKAVYCLLLDIGLNEEGTVHDVYLPAARTGFMLKKDIINKVSRRSVYNLDIEDEITPFTRPVNQFLDVMNDLSMKHEEERYYEIVKELEDGMIDGAIHMSMLPNKEVYYAPSGSSVKLPLRVVSAVVTELSPLILILKHMKRLDMLFYEEPEMCLHPQLQQKMAKVLCRLNYAGLNMIVTTHSDLILQHINNMIRLSCREDADVICRRFGYTLSDLLPPERVKVYQLSMQAGGMTEVEELKCSENGFAVPTFNHALEKINGEAYAIQE